MNKKINPTFEKYNFFDSKSETFRLGEEYKVHRTLGESIDNPELSFLDSEAILESRIKKLQDVLYSFIDTFEAEKKHNYEIRNEAELQLDTLEKDTYFRIKGNFETLADDINEQKSLNLLNQKQITNLKKEKNENTLDMNKLHARLDNIEKVLGINLKEKREKLEREKLNL